MVQEEAHVVVMRRVDVCEAAWRAGGRRFFGGGGPPGLIGISACHVPAEAKNPHLTRRPPTTTPQPSPVARHRAASPARALIYCRVPAPAPSRGPSALPTTRRAAVAGRAPSPPHFYLRLRDLHGLDSLSPHRTAQRLHHLDQKHGQSAPLQNRRYIIKPNVKVYEKQATVRGNARPSPSRFPISRTVFSVSFRLPTPEMSGLCPNQTPTRCT